MVKLDAEPDGGIAFDPNFFIEWPKGHLPASGAAAGRRLLVGFLLLSVSARRSSDAGPWVALPGLALFHGLNPAMGWLFAVALGLHRHSQRVVLVCALPIALGHAAAVAAVLAVALMLGLVLDPRHCCGLPPSS